MGDASREGVSRRRSSAALLSLGLAACARDDASLAGNAPPPPVVASSATSATSAASTATLPRDEGIPMPRPYRDRQDAAVKLNAACESCHDAEAAGWRASRHRQAYGNSAFQEALAVEPSGFCRGCHAPESDGRKVPSRAVSDLGVACVTCHVTEEGAVLAAPRRGAEEGGAPHAIRRSSDFGHTGACRGCHEFAFPGMHGGGDAELMQTTLREHARSPAAERACADCHMPLSGGRRAHGFAGVRDPAWLKARLRVTAERTGGGVRVTLAQTAPGHAFPTGDLFRRLEVGAELRDASGQARSRDVRHLARHFEIVPGYPVRKLLRDDRVADEPRAVDLALEPASGATCTIRWWVTYQRVATVGAGRDPAEAKIESEEPLYAGAIPCEPN